jgi:hypothetical protein
VVVARVRLERPQVQQAAQTRVVVAVEDFTFPLKTPVAALAVAES